MIQTQNKDKRVSWARDNEHNMFDDIVWMDESMIQLENQRDIVVQEGWRSSPGKSTSKAFIQGYGVGRYL